MLSLDSNVTEIIIDNGVSEPGLTELDLSQFPMLKRLVIGDHCLSYVERVKMVGMSELESVVVGENSCTKDKNSYNYESRNYFYLRNCPKIKSLKIGRYSFSDYTACIVSGVPSLEVIEMGDLNENSYNFVYASLELKSILIMNM